MPAMTTLRRSCLFASLLASTILARSPSIETWPSCLDDCLESFVEDREICSEDALLLLRKCFDHDCSTPKGVHRPNLYSNLSFTWTMSPSADDSCKKPFVPEADAGGPRTTPLRLGECAYNQDRFHSVYASAENETLSPRVALLLESFDNPNCLGEPYMPTGTVSFNTSSGQCIPITGRSVRLVADAPVSDPDHQSRIDAVHKAVYDLCQRVDELGPILVPLPTTNARRGPTQLPSEISVDDDSDTDAESDSSVLYPTLPSPDDSDSLEWLFNSTTFDIPVANNSTKPTSHGEDDASSSSESDNEDDQAFDFLVGGLTGIHTSSLTDLKEFLEMWSSNESTLQLKPDFIREHAKAGHLYEPVNPLNATNGSSNNTSAINPANLLFLEVCKMDEPTLCNISYFQSWEDGNDAADEAREDQLDAAFYRLNNLTQSHYARMFQQLYPQETSDPLSMFSALLANDQYKYGASWSANFSAGASISTAPKTSAAPVFIGLLVTVSALLFSGAILGA